MEIADLPEEVLLFLLSYLDDKSMACSSRVCLSWHLSVHTICLRRLCTIARDDQTSRIGLERWGWTREEHNPFSCVCVDICLAKFPWRKMENLKFEEFGEAESSLRPNLAITPQKIFVTQVKDSVRVLALERDTYETPRCVKEFLVETEVHLYSVDNTLVILSCKQVDNSWITFNPRLDNFTVSVWRVDTAEFVADIDFLVEANSCDGSDCMNSEISDVALEENLIALHIYGSGLLGSMSPSANITLFFTLDTKTPRKETISFLTRVKRPISESGFLDCGFIHMNKNVLVRSGETETDTVIQCFDMNQVKKDEPSPFYLYTKNFSYCEDVDGLDLKLEPGSSEKLAILYQSMYRKKLVIFDVKKRVEIVNMDLFGNFFVHHSNWCAGNLFLISKGDVFIKTENQYCYNDAFEEEEDGLKNSSKLVVVSKKSSVDILDLNLVFPQNACQSEDSDSEPTNLHVDLHGAVIMYQQTLLYANFGR